MSLNYKKYIIYIFCQDISEEYLLKRNLNIKEFRCLFFNKPSSFFNFCLKNKSPDVIMISKTISQISPRDMVLILRKNKKTSNSIIIFFSNKSLSEGKDFDSGIDEFFNLNKDKKELLNIRIFNLINRKNINQETQKIKFKNLEIDYNSRIIKLSGKEIYLTNLEFEILIYFLNNKNRIITRRNLMEAVWKVPYSSSLRSVDKRIEMLRKKLGNMGKHIQTVFSCGYIFRVH